MSGFVGLDSSDEEIVDVVHNGVFNKIPRNFSTISSSPRSTMSLDEEPSSSDSEEQEECMCAEVGIQCDIVTKSEIPWKTVISVIKKCLYIKTDCIKCMKELIDLCKTLKHEFIETEVEEGLKEDNVELCKASSKATNLTKGLVEKDAIPTEFQPSRSCSKQISAEPFHHMSPSFPNKAVGETSEEILMTNDRRSSTRVSTRIRRPPIRRYLDLELSFPETSREKGSKNTSFCSKAVGETNEEILMTNDRRSSSRIRKPPIRRYLDLEPSLIETSSEKGSEKKVDAIEEKPIETNSLRNIVIPNKRSSDINGRQTRELAFQRYVSQSTPRKTVSETNEQTQMMNDIIRSSSRTRRPPTSRYFDLEFSPLEIIREKGSRKKVDTSTSGNEESPFKKARREENRTLETDSMRNIVIPNQRCSDIIEGIETRETALQKFMSKSWSFEKLNQAKDLGERNHVKDTPPKRSAKRLARNWMKPNRTYHAGEASVRRDSLEENNKLRKLYSPTSWLDSDESIRFAEKRTSSDDIS